MVNLVERVLAGDHRAIARVITMIENDWPGAREALAALYPHTGRAHVVGVTGSPGVGKSTLVNQLVKLYRKRGLTVGIIAIDPTSPFSHGAVLGDRIRMQDHSGDPGVYIRSMATRGSLGGLALAAADAVKVVDAAGFEIIFVETVGAGQAEVEIARIVDTTIVVTAPGLGDDIQAIKAGIMEIANIFVVNKADRDGADEAVLTLKMMLDLGRSLSPRGKKAARGASAPHPPPDELEWQVPVCKTIATQNEGIEVVVEAVEKHRAYIQESGEKKRHERERVDVGLRGMVSRELSNRFFALVDEKVWEVLITRILQRDLDPYSAVVMLLGEACPSGPERSRRAEGG